VLTNGVRLPAEQDPKLGIAALKVGRGLRRNDRIVLDQLDARDTLPVGCDGINQDVGINQHLGTVSGRLNDNRWQLGRGNLGARGLPIAFVARAQVTGQRCCDQ